MIPHAPRYGLSKSGRVLDLERRKELVPYLGSCAYPAVSLMVNGKGKYHTMHRLMAMVFLPNPEHLSEVDHLDSDISNFQLENLEWVSSHENKVRQHKRRRVLKKLDKFFLKS